MEAGESLWKDANTLKIVQRRILSEGEQDLEIKSAPDQHG